MSMFQRKSPSASGDINKDQWTIQTLHEHVASLIAANDVRYSERFEASQSAINSAFRAQQTAMETALTAQQLSVDKALAAADRAVTKAEIAAEKRFESVNEFRATLADQAKTLMPRAESVALHKSIDDKVAAMQISIDGKLEALRASFEKSNENLSKEIAGLRESRSELAGHGAGANALWGYASGAAGVVIAVILLILRLAGK